MRLTTLVLLTVCLLDSGSAHASARPDPLAELGALLFFDVNLSRQRTQACAHCHQPEHAFVDPRANATGSAVSAGDDPHLLGTRNAPTLTYAALTPAFTRDALGAYQGGLFYDGRAPDLARQARIPLFSPLEMALPDEATLAARVRENPNYVRSLQDLYGPGITADASRVVDAITAALAAFEQTPQFSPFDSKYDRFLRGEYEMTATEEQGRRLFFSSLLNCSSCHLLNTGTAQTFTDYHFHNIGTPANPDVVQHGRGPLPDPGLLHNPAVSDPRARGKFKVPTLRNIAVTGPYMHNGVFRDLATVLAFYNRYIIVATRNPETNAPWRAPEVENNISLDLLRQGQPMDGNRIKTLIAFLRTLTDRRYESLLPPLD